MLRVLDLFSGIGGFSLGLERTGGFKTVAFCEIDDYCRRVLAKHWPDVPCHEDVRELKGERGSADVITGGFPCQPFSLAGKRQGDEDERHLWPQVARLVSEIRPRYAFLENVPGLLSGGEGRWFGEVLGDLAQIGYDAEWHCIPAAAVGAPHIRDRVWIIAYPDGKRLQGRAEQQEQYGAPRLNGGRLAGRLVSILADASRLMLDRSGSSGQTRRRKSTDSGWWQYEPDVGRVADGVPARVDRLRALGNAIVPQIAEMIGYAILEADRGSH